MFELPKAKAKMAKYNFTFKYSLYVIRYLYPYCVIIAPAVILYSIIALNLDEVARGSSEMKLPILFYT